MPVKNFSPELLKVFEAGSKKVFEFDCGTEKAALRLRWRLHALRREMRKERHWLVPVAESVIISVKGPLLIASPPDLNIQDSLTKALIEQAPEVMDIPKTSVDPITGNVSGIDAYLNRKKP